MDLSSLKFDRRKFLKIFSLTTLSALVPKKSGAVEDFRNDKNIPKQYIQNRDTPGFHIRSANPFLGVDMQNWGLAVGGMDKKPIGLGYEDLFGLKKHSQVSRLKCVECWSAKAKWEGFRFEELVQQVQPDPAAKFVYIQSADSYYESFMLEELLRPRVLFVLRMDGQPLSREHGFPLRLILPFKYGYKNIKYITHIKFLDLKEKYTFYFINAEAVKLNSTLSR